MGIASSTVFIDLHSFQAYSVTMKTIRRDTEALSLPKGRRAGQPGHAAALDFIEKRMIEEELTFFRGDSFRLEYALDGEEFCNLAGVIPGTDPEAMPILLGAHYDSAVDGPCSDDNAASVAVILSLCSALKSCGLRRTVIVAFFDAEERPYFGTEKMGSVRFCEDHCYEMDFASVVILDAIGHEFEILLPVLDKTIRRIREFIFVLGSESHSKFPGIVEKTADSVSGLRVIPVLNRYIGDSSDYLAFRKAGQPFIFISRGNGKYTHTKLDDLNWINWEAVEEVSELTLSIIGGIDRENMEEGRYSVDPFRFEIRLIKKAAGLLLPVLLPFLGIWKPALQSRRDLDSIAGKLSSYLKL